MDDDVEELDPESPLTPLDELELPDEPPEMPVLVVVPAATLVAVSVADGIAISMKVFESR
jgi:hypothetical protein